MPGRSSLTTTAFSLLVEVHVGVGPERGLAVAGHPFAAEQVEEHLVDLALQPRRAGRIVFASWFHCDLAS